MILTEVNAAGGGKGGRDLSHSQRDEEGQPRLEVSLDTALLDRKRDEVV